MSFEIARTLDEGTWRQFINENPAANIFHAPEMHRIFQQTPGYRPQLWFAINGRGEVCAMLAPVEITLLKGMLARFTTRAVVYGGPLVSPTPEGRPALSSLLQAYTARNGPAPLFTELRNLSDLTTVQPVLAEFGFAFEDHLNYLIDLNRPPEAVMQSIGSRTRKQIRRGLKKGEVVIEEVTRREELPGWYRILHKTYAAVQVPLADYVFFETVFNLLVPAGMIKFLLARVDGRAVACSAELLFKDIIYGWYSGLDREFSRYLPNEMLMWHILAWGAQNGYRVYDFGGAGKPDEEYGVRSFKAKFGGQLVNYGRNTYVPRPALLELSKRGYEIYRRFL